MMNQHQLTEINEHEFPRTGSQEQKLKFLLQYAVLAPSLHNTQPWRFTIHDNTIDLFADTGRWLKVTDPDQREIYISLGCALENLLIAASHLGYEYKVTYFPNASEREWIAAIQFTETQKSHGLADKELFYAIGLRHTHRQVYEMTKPSERDMQHLQASIDEHDLALQFTDDADIKQQIDALMTTADAIQFSFDGYRSELVEWMEQGTFGARWLINRTGQLATAYLNVISKQTGLQLPSPVNMPLLGFISTRTDDLEARVRAGQAFERLALHATSLNIALQPHTQVLQVASTKRDVARLFPIKETHPQMIFRLGYTDLAQSGTPRQSVDSVINQ
ncbi:MAG: hypothetical protein R3E39_31200 [Anaerolineae bacterium]